MGSLPIDAEHYHRSPVLGEVPLGQRRIHQMRAGIWSRVSVVEGAIAVVDDVHHARHDVGGGESFDVAPGLAHHVRRR